MLVPANFSLSGFRGRFAERDVSRPLPQIRRSRDSVPHHDLDHSPCQLCGSLLLYRGLHS